MAEQNGSAKYLYGIVVGSEDRKCGFSGIDGREVHVISAGQVAAVVSDVPNKKIRPERRHLAAHQEVLKHLMKETTILPASFGIIADDILAIRKILNSHQDTFKQELNRVVGKVEMGLRVSWDVPNIFQYFVDTHPELRGTRDHLLSSDKGLSQEEKIKLGQMFDRLLKEDRESHTERVTEIVRPCCVEIKSNPPKREQDVMDLACLINHKKQQEFEALVLKAASLFDNNFAFNYNGPWAPHNFVDLELKD